LAGQALGIVLARYMADSASAKCRDIPSGLTFPQGGTWVENAEPLLDVPWPLGTPPSLKNANAGKDLRILWGLAKAECQN
jgi:hypothetical protein